MIEIRIVRHETGLVDVEEFLRRIFLLAMSLRVFANEDITQMSKMESLHSESWRHRWHGIRQSLQFWRDK